MSTILRWLWIDAERWDRTGPRSLPSGAAVVIVASGLLSLIRFGGLVFEAPRSFARLMLVGVWGWLLLTLAVAGVAFVAGVVPRERVGASERLERALAITARSHLPLLALVGVVMVSGFFLRIYGPGAIASVFVLGVWFPAALVTGVRAATGARWRTAALVVAGPYLVWCLLIARHLLDQIEHLL